MTSPTDNLSGIAPVNRAFAVPPKGAAGRLGLWCIRLAGQIRRQYLSRLRPGYVAKVRAQRQGTCRRCGSCCDLTFHCPYLSESGCTHYEKRTLTCRDFPLDARDLRWTRVPCGHHYEGPPKKGPRANSAG
jgi:hypothetical protein